MSGTDVRISRQGLVLVGVSLALAAGLALFGILPERREQEALRSRMLQLQAEAEVRDKLRPLLSSLEKEKADAGRLNGLAAGSDMAPGSLPVRDIVPALAGLADGAGLQDASVVPLPESLDATALTMRVMTVARGDLESLRKFLLALAAAPFVQDVESVDITRPGQSLEFTLGVRLRLAEPQPAKRPRGPEHAGGVDE